MFAETVGLIHQSTRSDYGLDMVWCRWVAAQPRSRWNLCTACAVVEVNGFEKRYGTDHKHSYNLSDAVRDDRRIRQMYAPFESLCLIVGACRDASPPAAAYMQPTASTHRRFPYRQRVCPAPRPGLVIDGPCGAWRAVNRPWVAQGP